jgi:toxin ParE1/3/4
MPIVRRSALAVEDYRKIWRYIARDNPDTADRLLRCIDAKLELYLLNPRMGAMRDNLSPGLRSFSVGAYLAFYQAVEDGIELVRVLHGARDLNQPFSSNRSPDEPPK